METLFELTDSLSKHDSLTLLTSCRRFLLCPGWQAVAAARKEWAVGDSLGYVEQRTRADCGAREGMGALPRSSRGLGAQGAVGLPPRTRTDPSGRTLPSDSPTDSGAEVQSHAVAISNNLPVDPSHSSSSSR